MTTHKKIFLKMIIGSHRYNKCKQIKIDFDKKKEDFLRQLWLRKDSHR